MLGNFWQDFWQHVSIHRNEVYVATDGVGFAVAEMAIRNPLAVKVTAIAPRCLPAKGGLSTLQPIFGSVSLGRWRASSPRHRCSYT